MPSVWPVSIHLKKSSSVLKLELRTQNTPFKASSLVFQMAYRRDVGYYHQVSAFVCFFSLPVCVFILGAQLCQQWDLNGVLGRHHLWYIFSKSRCADENEGHNSTLEKQTLNNEIAPDEKAGITYSPRSGFQMAYLKDEALRRMIFMEIVSFSRAEWVCACADTCLFCVEKIENCFHYCRIRDVTTSWSKSPFHLHVCFVVFSAQWRLSSLSCISVDTWKFIV